jgi:hypothetical protein
MDISDLTLDSPWSCSKDLVVLGDVFPRPGKTPRTRHYQAFEYLVATSHIASECQAFSTNRNLERPEYHFFERMRYVPVCKSMSSSDGM